MIKKDKNILREARHIMSIDWRVRSDLALEGEFNLKYGITPDDYIKKYGTKEEIKELPGMWGIKIMKKPSIDIGARGILKEFKNA